MWRKEAIATAGGWQHDTLTEDLDLSYRAQIAGWKFVYRENVVTPGRAPGGRQRVPRAAVPLGEGHRADRAQADGARDAAPSSRSMQRIEAFFHLTPHFAYPLMVLLSVLLLPALILMPATDPRTMLLIDLPLCIGTTGSLAGVLRDGRGRRRAGRRSDALKQLPALLALGAGLAPHLTKAVFEGLRSMAGEFVRTPKKGDRSRAATGRAPTFRSTEIALCLISFASIVASLETRALVRDARSRCSSRSATATSPSSWPLEQLARARKAPARHRAAPGALGHPRRPPPRGARGIEARRGALRRHGLSIAPLLA